MMVVLCQEVGGVFSGLVGVSVRLGDCESATVPPSRPKHLALRLSIRNHRILIARRCTRPFTTHFPFGMPSHLVPLLKSSLSFFVQASYSEFYLYATVFVVLQHLNQFQDCVSGEGRARAIKLQFWGFESSTIQYGRQCKPKSHNCILLLIGKLASWISSANFVSKQPWNSLLHDTLLLDGTVPQISLYITLEKMCVLWSHLYYSFQHP